MPQKLKRNINMGFRVNEDEKFYIEKKMEKAGWNNFRAFVMNHLIRDEVVTVDLSGITDMNSLLRNIGNNINQIAARANSTGRVYDADLAEIKQRQTEIWEQQNVILSRINKFMEGKR